MASTTNLVLLVTKILSLMILFQSSNQASTADFSGLLARLYKRAADSNRPLFIIFSNEGQTNRQIKKPNKIFDLLGKELDLGHHHVAYDNFDKKKNNRPKVVPHRPKKSKTLGKQFSALLQEKKKSRSTIRPGNDQTVLQSPVLKSLLRISNNIRCVARNECEDECSGKYVSQKKQDNCKYECEEQFECEEEEQNSCEESDDECGETTGSTKGWTVTDAWNGCPEC